MNMNCLYFVVFAAPLTNSKCAFLFANTLASAIAASSLTGISSGGLLVELISCRRAPAYIRPNGHIYKATKQSNMQSIGA